MKDILQRLDMGVRESGVFATDWTASPGGPEIESVNPATGEAIGRVRTASQTDYEACVAAAQDSFRQWRLVPAPKRGELVRQFGNALRERKRDLGRLVSLETGKIVAEGEGEIQEMIDVADFAVGLSRQLYGLTIASERPEHRMLEQWHPLGPVGIITAFNFPAAVWAWNAMISTVCGNSNLWKPSPRTPLTAIAIQKILVDLCRQVGLPGLFPLCIGSNHLVGQWMANDARLPLISATGSTAMGKQVATAVAGRLGRSLLELGGNNAVIVTADADLDLALRAVVFAAVGTAGQRCTTLRRLFVQESIVEEFTRRIQTAYSSIAIGNPLDSGTLMGPLISEEAVEKMMSAIERACADGGEILAGGNRLDRPGFFVEPTLIKAQPDMAVVHEETFAPLLYLMTYRSIDEAIEWQNAVPQGLSSAIFTNSLRDSEKFLGPAGSDCGIANVNIGTSGAEIGGAFGGEKETGGGRESGSDSWKFYMRRQTCTINGGTSLPLAQGISFELPDRGTNHDP